MSDYDIATKDSNKQIGNYIGDKLVRVKREKGITEIPSEYLRGGQPIPQDVEDTEVIDERREGSKPRRKTW
jgi:hypothetical protein